MRTDSLTGSRPNCLCCGEPMVSLGLSGQDNGFVSLDICNPCMLIWFDDNELSRLANTAIIDLIRWIHDRVSTDPSRPSLPHVLKCPRCSARLKLQSRTTAYGRTSSLDCPNAHGHALTFLSFLAGNGYFRPYSPADINRLQKNGQHIGCSQCGAQLAPALLEACPHCTAPLGLVDPARLVRAINDRQEQTTKSVAIPARHYQADCPGCGAAVDFSLHANCPHCQAILLPKETASALDAGFRAAKALPENFRWKAQNWAASGTGSWVLNAALVLLTILGIGLLTYGVYFILKPPPVLSERVKPSQLFGIWSAECDNPAQGLEISAKAIRLFTRNDSAEFNWNPHNTRNSQIDFGSAFRFKNGTVRDMWIGSIQVTGDFSSLNLRDAVLEQRFPFARADHRNKPALHFCNSNTARWQGQANRSPFPRAGYGVPTGLRHWAPIGKCHTGPFIELGRTNAEILHKTRDSLAPERITTLYLMGGMNHVVPFKEIGPASNYLNYDYTVSLTRSDSDTPIAVIGLGAEYIDSDSFIQRGNVFFSTEDLIEGLPRGLTLIAQCPRTGEGPAQ